MHQLCLSVFKAVTRSANQKEKQPSEDISYVQRESKTSPAEKDLKEFSTASKTL